MGNYQEVGCDRQSGESSIMGFHCLEVAYKVSLILNASRSVQILLCRESKVCKKLLNDDRFTLLRMPSHNIPV